MTKYKFILLIVAILLLSAFALQIEGVTNFTGVHIQSSTLGTATPQFMIWNQGASQSIEIRSTAGTSVWSVNAAGNVSQSGGAVNNQNLVVSGPTAIGTATPAAIINNAGVSNLLEVRDSSTPVFTVGQNGTVTGLVLQYSFSGKKFVCITQTVTGTGTVSHGLATPDFAVCSLASDPTGTQWCTYTNSAGVVTAKVWKDVLSTPSASADPATVTTCVVGTP